MAVAKIQAKPNDAAVDLQNHIRKEQLRKSRALSASLRESADFLLSQGQATSALTVLSTALIVDPGRSATIHQMGKCFENLGHADDAAMCYRGSVPDSLSEKYFNAGQIKNNILSAVNCQQVSVLSAHDDENIDLIAPQRNATEKHYGQFSYRKTEARSTFCTVATDGALWFDGFNTVAFDCDSNVISEHIMGNEFACYATTQLIEPIEIDGTVCFLDGRSSSIYYHWMLDIVPKIGVMQKAGINLDDIDYFVVKAESGYQIASLSELGISKERIIFSDGNQYFKAHKMIVPYLRNSLGDKVYYGLGVGLGSWIPKYLQSQFGPEKSSKNNSVDNKRRVYISRSTRGSRNIANEAEIVELLQQRGFETVEFEGLSIAAQAELMFNAEAVVGVHGAGFTNLSFCQPGTKVVEIFGDYVVPCYWSLCGVAGLAYAQFMAQSESAGISDNPGAKVNELRDLQIVVDAQQFGDYLDQLLHD